MTATLAPWLQRSLQQLLAGQSHAVLIQGPSGLGQRLLGEQYAAARLCEQREADGRACGTCASCRLLASHTHPDCFYLLPETMALEQGYPLDEKAQKDLDEKKRKPRKTIGIDQVRDVVASTEQTSARARGQVVLVYPAEAMTIPAANAFLKTLEEPQGNVKLLLITEAAEQLLPTIRSRCSSLTLTWPAPDEALHYLRNQHPKADAAVLANALRAAGGRPLDADMWLGSGLAARWPELPRALAQGQATALADCSPQTALDALQKLCHDLWCAKVHAAPRYFALADLPPAPSARALHAWAQLLGQWARSIEHPLKPDLLLEDMVAQTRQFLKPVARVARPRGHAVNSRH